MAVNFFIPKKINVGFQNRDGTYTGKLAYIIYFDEKGKLRKEVSWDGWRDKKIENTIYSNEAQSGFVLNKKAGGYDSGWNHRQTYVRVYDPRGFEFEITVPNLLYILENATSTKGKGLEGEFVYGWDGKDLVLIPVDAPDYKELVKLNELRHSDKKIGARDLKIGATYRTKQNEEWIYMGKYDEYDWRGQKKVNKQFWFYCTKTGETWRSGFHQIQSVPQKLVEVISEECVENYADLFDQMERQTSYSPLDDTKTIYEPYTLEELQEKMASTSWLKVWSHFEGEELRHSISKYPYNGEYTYDVYNQKEKIYGRFEARPLEPEFQLRREEKKADTLLEIYEDFTPHRKYEYLANGKLHREATY